ncbi:MAG: GNAT family N-acetyltransferase [Pseudomonadota bacterium]
MSRAGHLYFESERLTYRPLEQYDLDLMVEQWSDPEVIKYIDCQTYDEDELREEMPLVTRRAGGGCIGIWILADKESGEKLGTAILLPLPVEADDTEWDLVREGEIPDREIEVGYILKQAAWGRGFATEACRRMIRFGFECTPLDEIVAAIDPENHVSRKVLQKSGMREEGLIRAYAETIPGFRITRAEWLRANP